MPYFGMPSRMPSYFSRPFCVPRRATVALIAVSPPAFLSSLQGRHPLLGLGHVARVAPLGGVAQLRRGQVAVGPARVAGDEHEVVVGHAVGLDLEEVRRAVGHVVRRVIGRLAVLADVGAVEREVAGVARPRPVVDLAAVVADARGAGRRPGARRGARGTRSAATPAAEEAAHVAAHARAVLLAGGDELLLALLDLVVARARGRAISARPAVTVAVTSVNVCATLTRWVGPAQRSSARVLARKPFSRRLSSGVELSWSAPCTQWWLVTTSPSGETNEAVQPPSETTADSGGRDGSRQRRRVDLQAELLEPLRVVEHLARHPHAAGALQLEARGQLRIARARRRPVRRRRRSARPCRTLPRRRTARARPTSRGAGGKLSSCEAE